MKKKILFGLWCAAFILFVGGKKPVFLMMWVLFPFFVLVDFMQKARVWNNYDTYIGCGVFFLIPYYCLLALLVKWILKVGGMKLVNTKTNQAL